MDPFGTATVDHLRGFEKNLKKKFKKRKEKKTLFETSDWSADFNATRLDDSISQWRNGGGATTRFDWLKRKTDVTIAMANASSFIEINSRPVVIKELDWENSVKLGKFSFGETRCGITRYNSVKLGETR